MVRCRIGEQISAEHAFDPPEELEINGSGRTICLPWTHSIDLWQPLT
ncbi:hypothetical protein RBWH47_01591 [Rhodopirellula baltica WH47]|uniref:Uncharacterized protein n=1 Tax=Rhodopirellula baltica WH47 TaxID=991778 RepID=F2B2B1_RHOBT|nr:hypothetical protein RBWH47_01591 [Rhodopirellula baltica WH47]